MTSRRSLRTWEERVSRISQFVPGHVGGRVASAQPIRRRGGTLRNPSVGAVATVPVTAPAYVTNGYWAIATGGTSISISGIGGSAGHIVVAMMTGYNSGCGAPSGWTTLASGTVTNLDYLIAYKVLAGGDSFTFTTPDNSPGWTWGADGTHYARITAWRFDATGTGTPVASVTETAAGSTVAMETPNGAWVAPWNAFASAPSDQSNGQTLASDPSTMFADDMLLDLDFFIDTGYGATGGFDPPVAVTGDMLATEGVAPYTTPQNAEWVMAAFGWA